MGLNVNVIAGSKVVPIFEKLMASIATPISFNSFARDLALCPFDSSKNRFLLQYC